MLDVHAVEASLWSLLQLDLEGLSLSRKSLHVAGGRLVGERERDERAA